MNSLRSFSTKQMIFQWISGTVNCGFPVPELNKVLFYSASWLPKIVYTYSEISQE